jgi:MtN3 and saliva related transmembrane protein
MTEWIGAIAGIFTTVAFFPQVWKTLKTKSAHDFSFVWLVMTLSGVLLWLVYGFLIQSISLMAANSATFACILAITAVKLFKKA